MNRDRFGDWTEELCIICLAAIAGIAVFKLGAGADTLVSGITGGLIGYLTRGLKK